MTKNELKIKEKENHEIVIQGNQISKSIYSCSLNARKTIAYAMLRYLEDDNCKDHPTEGYLIQFRASDLLRDLGLTLCGQNYLLIKEAVKEAKKADIDLVDTNTEYEGISWFDYASFNKTKDLIKLRFTPEIATAMLNYKIGFTQMNIKTIGEFKSFYAFRFYEIAVSNMGHIGKNGNKKNQWFFEMTVKEIREKFKIADEKYADKMNNFILKVIREPIKEINNINDDFQIEVIKLVSRNKTYGFRFVCTKIKNETKIQKADSKETKKVKKEINTEESEIAYFKNKYPEEFSKIYELEKKQQVLFSGTGFTLIAESNTVNALKEKGFN